MIQPLVGDTDDETALSVHRTARQQVLLLEHGIPVGTIQRPPDPDTPRQGAGRGQQSDLTCSATRYGRPAIDSPCLAETGP